MTQSQLGLLYLVQPPLSVQTERIQQDLVPAVLQDFISDAPETDAVMIEPRAHSW